MKPAAPADDVVVPDDLCPHDASRLAPLRRWAWDRGRTDVVWDLDLHAAAWAFQSRPEWRSLVHLAHVLPPPVVEGAGSVAADALAELRRVAATGPAGADLEALRVTLTPWSQALCLKVAADAAEMSAVS